MGLHTTQHLTVYNAIISSVVVMRRGNEASCRACLTVNRVLLGAGQHETQQDAGPYNLGRQNQTSGENYGPFIMAPVNQSPASNKKITIALCISKPV